MEIWKFVSLLVLSKWKDGGQFWIEILVWRICFIFYCYIIVVVQLSCGSYIYVFMLYSQTNTTHLSPILHTVEWRIEVSTNIYPVFLRDFDHFHHASHFCTWRIHKKWLCNNTFAAMRTLGTSCTSYGCMLQFVRRCYSILFICRTTHSNEKCVNSLSPYRSSEWRVGVCLRHFIMDSF